MSDALALAKGTSENVALARAGEQRALFLEQGPDGVVGRQGEDGGGAGLGRAAAHQARIGARAGRQSQSVENDGFAGAGLPGQGREPGTYTQVQGLDQHHVAYAQADLSRPAGYNSGYEKTIHFDGTWMSAPAQLEQPADLTKRIQTAVLCLGDPITLPAGSKLVVRVKSEDIGRIRISASPVLNPVPGQPAFSSRFLSAFDTSKAPFHLCSTPAVMPSAMSPPSHILAMARIRTASR